MVLTLWGAPAIVATDWAALPALVWITLLYTAVMASAATFVLLTREKLGLASPWKIMPLAAASGLIVPAGLSSDVLTPYRDMGVEVIEA